jgi:hypothetical protein
MCGSGKSEMQLTSLLCSRAHAVMCMRLSELMLGPHISTNRRVCVKAGKTTISLSAQARQDRVEAHRKGPEQVPVAMISALPEADPPADLSRSKSHVTLGDPVDIHVTLTLGDPVDIHPQLVMVAISETRADEVH